jgi:hypothetical protein
MPGCGIDDGGPVATATARDELRDRRPVLIQPGDDQLVLAVTEDNYVLYQEGQTVYASALVPGAPRSVVAEVPVAGNQAFPLQVGKVVLLWTNPDFTDPAFGVGPLVMWTARGGAVRLSETSVAGLVATAVSPDSQQVLFITHVDPGASAEQRRGDLALALTRHPEDPQVLLSNIDVSFPSGQCRPSAGFTGGAIALPIAQYCKGSDTTGTLSVWERGKPRDLIDNLVTPLQLLINSDPDVRKFPVSLADGTLATVDLAGRKTIVDHARTTRAFISGKGTVGYTVAATATTAGELRLARRDGSVKVVSPAIKINAELYNYNGYFKEMALSPDARLITFSTTIDPATGLTDQVLIAADRGDPIALDTAAETRRASEVFTADSRHALFLAFPDPQAQPCAPLACGQVITNDRPGPGHHAVSATAKVFDLQRATGSLVSYAEAPTFNADLSFNNFTADLTVADADDPSAAPRVISKQVTLQYQRTADREHLIFWSRSEPAGPGIYIARAQL